MDVWFVIILRRLSITVHFFSLFTFLIRNKIDIFLVTDGYASSRVLHHRRRDTHRDDKISHCNELCLES